MTDIIASDAVMALIQVVFGLLLAGGVLLLWVCWKMWRELQDQRGGDETLVTYTPGRSGTMAGTVGRKTFGHATLRIVVADVSMSLDNVLAVAGAAREHPIVLAFGLLLSITLMGVAVLWRSIIAVHTPRSVVGEWQR